MELVVVVNEESGKAKQGTSTFIIRLLVEHYKDKIIEKFGEEDYKELHEKYSKDILTQKKEKLEDEEAKQVKAEEKLRQRAKILELKERELAIREANTGLRSYKEERVKVSREEKEKQAHNLHIRRHDPEVKRLLTKKRDLEGSIEWAKDAHKDDKERRERTIEHCKQQIAEVEAKLKEKGYRL